jgi:hypothetical protein
MIIVINGHIPNYVCFMALIENPMVYLFFHLFPTNCLPLPFVCWQNFQTPISCTFDDHLCICGYFPPTNIDSFFVFIAMLVSWVCLLPKVGRPQQGSPGCLGTRWKPVRFGENAPHGEILEHIGTWFVWWFGTWLLLFHILGIIIPTD